MEEEADTFKIRVILENIVYIYIYIYIYVCAVEKRVFSIGNEE